MKKHLRPLVLIFVISILIGVIVGTAKKVYMVANKTEPEMTYEDAIQLLDKDIDKNVDYTEKTTFVQADLPQGMSADSINKNSTEEIIAMFAIDVSGSMKTKHEDKLSKVQTAINDFLPNVGPNTYIGMVSYSTGVTVNVPIAKFDENQAKTMFGELNNLKATGGTEMYEGIAVALKQIANAKDEHPNARAMLFVISDGKPSEGAKGIDFVEKFVKLSKIPVHTIGYGKDIDKVELKKLADINEATFTYVQDEDVLDSLNSLLDSSF